MPLKTLPKPLLELGTLKTFKKHDQIYTLQTPLTHCYFIISGMAKVFVNHKNGRRSILDFVGEQDWLGELSLFCEEKDPKENEVLQEMTCYAFDISRLKEVCLSDPVVSYYFAAYISNKLLSRSYRLSEGLNFPLDNRLALFILTYQKNGLYAIAHTHASEYLNVSYRHVLFVMKHLTDVGLIEKQGSKTYKIVDVEGLKAMVEKV